MAAVSLTKVIVIVWLQHLTGLFHHPNKTDGQGTGVQEPPGQQGHLSNGLVVSHHHGHWPQQQLWRWCEGPGHLS